jgi:hypothetical protein
MQVNTANNARGSNFFAIFDLWSTPANLGPLVNSGANDNAPTISSDRETLYFASNRAGGAGLLDLWVSTRRNGRD